MFRKLFGQKAISRQDDAADLESLKSQFAPILIELPDQVLAGAYDSWAWLRVPNDRPFLVSAFGDAFFRVPKGVLLLDTLTGTLEPVAKDIRELREKFNSVEAQDHLLKSVWVQAAHRRGLSLSIGECFDWTLHPALGGSISADNIGKIDFVVWAHIAGQLHQQIKNLPPGTKINRVTIAD